MRTRNLLIISILIFLLSGCDDKHINHGYRYRTDMGVNWDYTDKPADADIGTVIIITDSNGKQTILPGGNGIDNVPVDWEDGRYTVVVGDDVQNISYDDNKVVVDTNTDGSILEPPPFSAGESAVKIDKGSITEGDELIMHRQTRELVVKVRILSGLRHFRDIVSFKGVFDGVTVSRDLLYSFPPAGNPGRLLSEDVYGLLNMEFNQITDSSDQDVVYSYQARYRLMGIGPDNTKTITLSYRSKDLSDVMEEVFYVLDVTDMITDFHTLESVENPYVLIIDLIEDPSTGEFSIEEWKVADPNELIAEEQ